VGLSEFFTRSIASVQQFVESKQAEVTGAVASALAWIRGAIMGTLQAAQTLATRIRERINEILQRITDSVQNRVEGITGQITGLINSIPLPDIPGVGLIRSSAVGVLNGAARIVSGAFGTLVGVIRSVFNAGMNVLDSVLGAIVSALDVALSAASTAVLAVLQMIGQALSRAVSVISSSLRAVLLSIIVPLLNGLEALIGRLIGVAEQRAVGLLRANRNEYLGALAEVVFPSAEAPGSRATTRESPGAVIQQLGRDATQNSRLIVQTFELVIGGAMTLILRTLITAAARLVAGVASAVAQVVQAIVSAITQVIRVLAQAAQAIDNFVRELIRSLTESLGKLVESVGSVVDGGVDQLIQFARTALSRITGFIGRFVRNLVLGRGVGESLSEAIGDFRLTPSSLLLYRGPPPLPPGLVVLLIIAVLVAIVEFFGGFVVVVGSTVFIFVFGISITTTVTVVVIVAVAIVLLVLLLLYLLYRWLTKPKTPGKRVILVTPSVLELGVGGRDIDSTATISPGVPARPPLKWTINPGGVPPARVSVIGSGQTVRVRAAQPPHGTIVGGTPITVRAELAANPADFADSAAVMMVQVLSAAYVAAPPLVPVPITTPGFGPGIPPPNTAEPNRDGIAGNTAVVNATLAPAGRPIVVTFRRSLGATLAGATVTPGTRTGDIGLRISETATDARLDETLPSTAGPATLMADLTVNAVPTAVTALTFSGRDPAGPYSAINAVTFAVSDNLHPPLTRIVGELITGVADDFNIQPPNGAFNPVFRLDLAVPANLWNDLLLVQAMEPNVADGLPAIDVNRFIGPGAPGLPRRLIYRQRFQYSSWRGAGTVISPTLADGQHIKLLLGSPPTFNFKIEHRFPGATPSTPAAEPYAGNGPPLIVLSNVVAAATAPGATALAADGVATANLGVTSTVPGRIVNWTVLNGDIVIIGGNPAPLPAPALLRAGVLTGNFGVRASDTIFPNRRVDGRARVVAVALRSMRVSPNPVPPGVASTAVTLTADPGGRTVRWTVDNPAVTVTPNVTGPGAPPMTVSVTRPAGFSGTVAVTATDSVLAARTNSVAVRFV